MSQLNKIVIHNLLIVLNNPDFDLNNSKKFNFAESTLRNWKTYNRAPSLKMLDSICDSFSIPTYILFMPNVNIDTIKKSTSKSLKNNSRTTLNINLNKYLKSNKSITKLEYLSGGELSISALRSYIRSNEYRTPSIEKISLIASFLGVPAYKLVKP